MAVVLKLVNPSNEETVKTLVWMLEQARNDQRFCFCGAIRTGDGQEQAVRTGLYKADRSKAVMAIVRVKAHLIADDSSFDPL